MPAWKKDFPGRYFFSWSTIKKNYSRFGEGITLAGSMSSGKWPGLCEGNNSNCYQKKETNVNV
jgi:hypothetical protein